MCCGKRCFAAALLSAMVIFIGGCSSPSRPPIFVTLSPSSPKAVDQSQTVLITATVSNDISSKGVTWSLSGPGSLGNSTTSQVTYQSPTTSLSNAQQATITATSVLDQTKRASVQITIHPYPQIPSQTLQNGSAGMPYSQMIALTGGTPPFQWSVYNGPIATGWRVGGAVPDGLSLNASTGAITGTPTNGGTWYFEASVTDATGVAVENGFLSIQIDSNTSTGNAIPFINRPLVPTAVSPGNNSFVLKVSGTSFVSGATIDFNGASLATTFVDSEHVSATVPAANVATARTASVTVVNPAPGGGQSNVVYFEVGMPDSTVNFVSAPNSPVQIYSPSGIVIDDFNEDGKPDLAIAGNVAAYVFLGNGDGTFAPAQGSPLPMPSPPYDDFGSPHTGPALAVGDFNNSGHSGLAVGLFQNEAAAVLFGNGKGTFTYSDTLANAQGMPLTSLTAADFNGDGDLDMIALGGVNGASPIALLGYGRGGFNAVFQNVEIVGSSLAAGDFNGDGKLDLVINNKDILSGNNTDSILLGHGDGTFTPGGSLNGGDFVTVADFNGDGKLDFAVCNSATNMVTIFLGDGTGNFASSDFFGVGNQPDAIVSGDFNNDGKLDLAVANYGDGTVVLLLGNGDGTFTFSSNSPYSVGHGPDAIAAADFNSDGKLDLAVSNLTDGTVSILLQQ